MAERGVGPAFQGSHGVGATAIPRRLEGAADAVRRSKARTGPATMAIRRREGGRIDPRVQGSHGSGDAMLDVRRRTDW